MTTEQAVQDEVKLKAQIEAAAGYWREKATHNGKELFALPGGFFWHELLDAVNATRTGDADTPDRGEGWQPIETAPKDGTQFLALNGDGEVWVAKYEKHGRICFRTNSWRNSFKYTTREIEGQEWRLYDEDWETNQSRWENNWTLWTRGYDFQPSHWMPLPPAPVRP